MILLITLSTVLYGHSQNVNEQLSQKTTLTDFDLSKSTDSIFEYEWSLDKDGTVKQRRGSKKIIFNKNGTIARSYFDNKVRYFTYENKYLKSIHVEVEETGHQETVYELTGNEGKSDNATFHYKSDKQLDSIVEKGLMGNTVTCYSYDDRNNLKETRETFTGKISGRIGKDLVVLYHLEKPYATFDLASGDMQYLRTEKGLIQRKNIESVVENLKRARQLLASTRGSAVLVRNPFDRYRISYLGWTVEQQYFNTGFPDWTASAQIFGSNLEQPLRWIDTRVIYYSDGSIKGSELPNDSWLQILPQQLEKTE